MQHFAEKYHTQVERYYEANKDNPAKIKADVARFDAGQMTPGRLAAVYGPAATAAEELSRTGHHQESTNARIHQTLGISSATVSNKPVSDSTDVKSKKDKIEESPTVQPAPEDAQSEVVRTPRSPG